MRKTSGTQHLSILCALLASAASAAAQGSPNVIVFLADDLGFGDVGPYDHDADPLTPEVTNTPVLDQLATEGVSLTSFYTNSPVCSPTRAGLLTGRHSIRSGITHVFTAGASSGLPLTEVTLAEMVAPVGYRTGLVGKWHLGDAPAFLPLQQGFDEFYGVPYSNNVSPLPVLRGNTIILPDADQTQLTQSFTTEAQLFIERAVGDGVPFLLYVAYTAPHVPLYVSPAFADLTGRGLYADCVYELDDSIGRILDLLDLLGITNDTFVMFTSDNGACDNNTIVPHAGSPGANEPQRWACGSNAPFKGFKFGFFDGGLRAPFIARWPGVLPAGVERDALSSVLDVLPTVATLTGAVVPQDRPLDGEDLFGLLTVDAPRQLDELHFYELYQGAQWGTRTLKCSRRLDWKQFYDAQFSPLAMFNVQLDPAETQSVGGPMSPTLWDRSRDFHCALDDPLAVADPQDLASRRPMLTSSSTDCSTSSHAVDGDLTTVWNSSPLIGQTLRVDLGSPRTLERVILEWGVPFATRYRIEVSNDDAVWQEVHVTSSGNGGRDIIAMGLTARYLRLVCMGSDGLGYALRELSIQPDRLPDVYNAPK